MTERTSQKARPASSVNSNVYGTTVTVRVGVGRTINAVMPVVDAPEETQPILGDDASTL